MGKIINDHEYIVMALRRSGQHAIISWIMALTNGDSHHLNNVRPNRNPYNCVGHAPKNKDWVRNGLRGKFKHVACLVYNYEHRPIGQLTNLGFDHNKCVGASGATNRVLILRDPFNNAASLRKRIKNKNNDYGDKVFDLRSFTKVWRQYAQEFAGDTNLFKNKVCINYNRWCTTASYRLKIAEQLGIKQDSSPYLKVPRIGMGSSFDSRKFNGKADQMEFTTRWETYRDRPKFRALFDSKTIKLYRRIFDPIPGIEDFL